MISKIKDLFDLVNVLDLSDVGEVLRWWVFINIPAPLANGLEGETLALDLDDYTDYTHDEIYEDIVLKGASHLFQVL